MTIVHSVMTVMHAVMTVLPSVMPFAVAVLVTMHLAVAMTLRHRGPHWRLAVAAHRRLAAAYFLGAPFDFRNTRRVRAFPDAALRRLRNGSGGAEQQRQNGECDSVHLHHDLSFRSNGVLSGKYGNWFLWLQGRQCLPSCVDRVA